MVSKTTSEIRPPFFSPRFRALSAPLPAAFTALADMPMDQSPSALEGRVESRKRKVSESAPILVRTDQQEAKEANALRYRNANVVIGGEVGERHYFVEYQTAEALIKLPSFRRPLSGEKYLRQMAEEYLVLRENPELQSLEVIVIEANLGLIADGVYVRQPIHPRAVRFSLDEHMPKVVETLRALFQCCYEGTLPPINLDPANLIYIDGRLGLSDWVIVSDEDDEIDPNRPGALFQFNLPVILKPYGSHAELIDPRAKRTRIDDSQ
jgi:hypothetical protein